jgi:branched-chain amino acid transport system ATP-binding protein
MQGPKRDSRVIESSDGSQLQVVGLTLSFGGIRALIDVGLEIEGSEILAIIGPNGAGKTCTINCISGFYRPDRGDIHFNGRKINALPPYKRAELGISRTFQNMQLYAGLSTLDNLMAARHIHLKPNTITSALYFGWGRKKEIKHRRKVEELIDFLEMEPIRHKIVGSLPYGQRKRVDLGRALALDPKLLLLDEPMAGMNVEEKEDMARFILDIHELKKIPIVLVEHDMGVVMDIADRIVVLDFGINVAEGRPSEIKANPDVIKVYLGEER